MIREQAYALRAHLIGSPAADLHAEAWSPAWLQSARLDVDFLETEILAYHLEGLFQEFAKGKNLLSPEAESRLQHHLDFRRKFNALLLGTLNEIAALRPAGSEPVILKGISFWPDLYGGNPSLRRVNDIDLLELQEALLGDWVECLIAAGYAELNPETRLYLTNAKYYSLPPLEKSVLMNDRDALAFKNLLPYYPDQLKKQGNNLYYTIRVELHKSLFLQEGTRPVLDVQATHPASHYPHFRVLADRVNIAYMALKFYNDFHTSKMIPDLKSCIKLFADTKRLLERADDPTRHEALALAARWNVLDKVQWTLSNISSFIPNSSFQEESMPLQHH